MALKISEDFEKIICQDILLFMLPASNKGRFFIHNLRASYRSLLVAHVSPLYEIHDSFIKSISDSHYHGHQLLLLGV